MQAQGGALPKPSAGTQLSLAERAQPQLAHHTSTPIPAVRKRTWEGDAWEAGLANRREYRFITRMIFDSVSAMDGVLIHMNRSFGILATGLQISCPRRF